MFPPLFVIFANDFIAETREAEKQRKEQNHLE